MLKAAEIENSRLEADMIVAHATGIDRVTLFAHPEITVSVAVSDQIDSMLVRRIEGYPLAYLIGHRDFYGLQMEVREGVLVPRPDTETLIDAALSMLEGKNTCKIFDLGCGSGCICVSLGSVLPGASIQACDISEIAVEVTRSNIQKHNLSARVDVKLQDMRAALENVVNEYDAIVSNPPYIPSADIDQLQPEISKYEPREALDGGLDGLRYYPEIFQIAAQALKPEGFVAVEVGIGQANQVEQLAVAAGLRSCKVVTDLAGIERVVIASK